MSASKRRTPAVMLRATRTAKAAARRPVAKLRMPAPAGVVWSGDDGLYLRADADRFGYSDGAEVEQRLYAVVATARDCGTFSPELLGAIVDWPSEYHLSRSRHALLRPLEIRPGQRVLELGCGCGAITRYLGEIGAQVVAVEGSLARARVAAQRCRDLANVCVVADDLSRFSIDATFDWVLLVGVLEYAGLFATNLQDPDLAYLRSAAKFLAPGGRLVVAIENRLGLKYFSGIGEDHLGQPFIGIEGRYATAGPRTYGRRELESRLHAAGLQSVTFLFPYPDYKLPSVVLADDAFQHEGFNPADMLARSFARDYGGQNAAAFNEALVAASLVRNGIAADLSNSFLVVAQRKGEYRPSRLAWSFGVQRNAQYATQTAFAVRAGRIRVERRAVGGADASPVVLDGLELRHSLEVGRYVSGENFVWRILRAKADGAGAEQIATVLQPWARKLIEAAAEGEAQVSSRALADLRVPGNLVDAVPFNLILTSDGAEWIDLEWRAEQSVALGWVLARGLMHTLIIGPSRSAALIELKDVFVACCESASLQASPQELERWIEQEYEFQRAVSGLGGHAAPQAAPKAASSLARSAPEPAPAGTASNQDVQPETTTATLYLGTGKDPTHFSAATALHCGYLLDGQQQTIRFANIGPIDEPLTGLRLDLATRVCQVELIAIEFRRGASVLWRWAASTEPFALPWTGAGGMLTRRLSGQSTLGVICLNDDPQCLLALSDEVLGSLAQGAELQIELRAALLAGPELVGLDALAETLDAELAQNRARLEQIAAAVRQAGQAQSESSRAGQDQLARLLHQLEVQGAREGQRAAELEALAVETRELRMGLAAAQVEVHRATQQVAELAAERQRLQAELQGMSGQAAAERTLAADLDARNRALERSLQQTELRLTLAEEAARARDAEARSRIEDLAARTRAAEAGAVRATLMHEQAASALTSEREQGRADAQRFAADAAAQRVMVERLERETADLRQSLDAMRASRSWRITAPLRAVSGALRSGGALALLRAVAAKTVRRVYRGLPVSFESKRKVKDWVFRRMPGPFEGTAAYRQWKAFTAETSALRTMRFDPPPAIPSREAGVAALDPQYDMAMATALPQADAPGPATTTEPAPMVSHEVASLHALPQADGRWEWEDYVAVSEHVQHGLQQQRAAAAIAPIEILDFEPVQLDACIAELYFPSASTPEVTLLIPTYGNLKYTVECLSSIAVAGAQVSYEVLIADDASSDRTAERLADVPNLRVLAHPENLNFLRNVNRALPQVRGEYCVLLNNDVQVTAGWLDALVEAAKADPKVGAVGPRILYPSGHLQEAGCSFRPDCTSDMVGLTQAAGLPQFSYARAVDYCSGAALLVRTALFREVGGFSEEFAPAYCEDSDLCLKLRAAGYRVLYEPRSTIVHHLSKTTAAQDSAEKLTLIGRNLDRFARKWQSTIDTLSDVRLICFYLPQFHAIPENDRWWGQGFTEWSNVAKAKPNFVGHYQPRLPADLGYYDLRVAEVMDQQAELARRYGIGGFCYYYYWFAGRRLLEMPLERMIRTGKPDLPFCLCWANENWTRRWDGQDQEVLMAQAHSDQDDEAVILDLIRYMRLQHYIRIDGRPLLLVYRVGLFPDFARTAQTWRRICLEQGIGEIYLAMVESFEMVFKPTHPSVYGCDAAVEFPPQGMAEVRQTSGPVINPAFKGQVGDYRELAVRYCLRPHVPYTRFRGIMPGWDNTARRQDNSFAFEHATPGAFQAWAEHVIDQTRTMRSGDERIVFVNAWNEWAEGAYLEPDRRYGHAFLEALKNAREAAALKRRNRYMLG